MFKNTGYGSILVKAIFAFVAAIGIVLGVVLLMGIHLMTCDPAVIFTGICAMGIFLWIVSVI